MKQQPGSVALFGQQTKEKEKGKRKKCDLANVTCYGCGMKGLAKHRCPDKIEEGREGERNGKGDQTVRGEGRE